MSLIVGLIEFGARWQHQNTTWAQSTGAASLASVHANTGERWCDCGRSNLSSKKGEWAYKISTAWRSDWHRFKSHVSLLKDIYTDWNHFISSLIIARIIQQNLPWPKQAGILNLDWFCWVEQTKTSWLVSVKKTKNHICPSAKASFKPHMYQRGIRDNM